MTPLLSLRRLKKSYAGRRILDISALQLAEGDIAMLAGDNGAGKTTLLKILAGLLPPDACAELIFAGGIPPAAPAVVYLQQTPYLFNTTVRANVEYGLRRCRLPLQAATAAMEWAGMASFADRRVRALSGGEQRRVALARVRALSPRLYLLDEPAAHLDADGVARVHELIELLKKEGATAVISAHQQTLPATVQWRLHNGDIVIN